MGVVPRVLLLAVLMTYFHRGEKKVVASGTLIVPVKHAQETSCHGGRGIRTFHSNARRAWLRDSSESGVHRWSENALLQAAGGGNAQPSLKCLLDCIELDSIW